MLPDSSKLVSDKTRTVQIIKEFKFSKKNRPPKWRFLVFYLQILSQGTPSPSLSKRDKPQSFK